MCNTPAYQAGALAFRERVSYELNPHVPGGLAVAKLCRLHDWPEEARQWHAGWRDAAIARADAAESTKEAVA